VLKERHLRGKPEPDSFLEAARQLGVEPSRAVVVEDAISGVQAGHCGGVWSRGGRLPKERRGCLEVLFFDEPSAGLDPISSRLLDELILELRDSLGATIVVVTHELASIFTIANNSVFLDAESRTQIATGDPHEMLAHSTDPRVRKFLTRGAEKDGVATSNG
jgi:ABC-type thiamine transport system ATPase subunit